MRHILGTDENDYGLLLLLLVVLVLGPLLLVLVALLRSAVQCMGVAPRFQRAIFSSLRWDRRGLRGNYLPL